MDDKISRPLLQLFANLVPAVSEFCKPKGDPSVVGPSGEGQARCLCAVIKGERNRLRGSSNAVFHSDGERHKSMYVAFSKIEFADLNRLFLAIGIDRHGEPEPSEIQALASTERSDGGILTHGSPACIRKLLTGRLDHYRQLHPVTIF